VITVGMDDSVTVETAVVVDRDVRHLETQLYNNRIQQLIAERLFGSRPRGLYNGNEYLDERYRIRMMRPVVGDVESVETVSESDRDASAAQESNPLAPTAV